MDIRTSWGFCAAMLLISACSLGPPQLPPPGGEGQSGDPEAAATSRNLSPAQTAGVLECETAIQFQGTAFTTLSEAALNQCFDATLSIQIASENNQISSTQYNQELSAVRGGCAQQFRAIGGASTRLVNGIVAACSPVQNEILPTEGYDPLQFGALAESQGLNLAGNVTGLAGRICGAKELFVDALVDVQTPRMVGLLEVLDNGTGQFAASGPSSSLLASTTIPNIPLDTRCVSPTLPR